MTRLVFLHGFTQGPGSWDPVIERLGAGHTSVRITLPGHGGAGAVESSFEEAAAGLAAAGGSGTWVGYSLGGRLALRVALDRPDLVERLVLLGASPGLAGADERAARVVRDETLAGGLEGKGLDAFLDGWLRQPLFGRLPRSAAGLEERRRNTVEGLASVLRRFSPGVQEPLWDRLAELAMPTLLMAGEHDTKFTAVAFRMAGAMKDVAGVSVVPGAGHAAHLERPESFAALLQRAVR